MLAFLTMAKDWVSVVCINQEQSWPMLQDLGLVGGQSNSILTMEMGSGLFVDVEEAFTDTLVFKDVLSWLVWVSEIQVSETRRILRASSWFRVFSWVDTAHHFKVPL